jgi:uncharacterized protein YbbC (DUF1343 family)
MASAQGLVPGVARFDLYGARLAGKKVGLVVNQASVFRGMHTIDYLLSRGVRVERLFALEHGVRGEGGAGEEINDSVDEKTGIPIVSLYGPRKKPDAAALAGLDVIIYDIQDVGVRFFTYISSLGLIMEAAGEQGKAVIVLDRPNPNGDYTDGPLLQPENKSFVGAFPIPLVYGLTPGELAKMILGERWQKVSRLDLFVAPLQGYKRAVSRPLEVRPSPGLRSHQSLRIYPSLALFEPTIISVGRGTDHPFEQYGLPQEGFGRHTFTPNGSLYRGELCHGEEFHSRSVGEVPRFTTDIFVSALARAKRKPFLTNPRFLELLVGDKRVVQQMLEGRPYSEIRKGFAEELADFVKRRKPYLLY